MARGDPRIQAHAAAALECVALDIIEMVNNLGAAISHARKAFARLDAILECSALDALERASQPFPSEDLEP